MADTRETESSGPRVVPASQVELGQLHVEADLRRHDAALAVAFLRGDAAHREAAAWSLARIGGEQALPLLSRGLTDPEPSVRAAVSFGLGITGLPVESWLGAAVAETDQSTAALMLEDLGRGFDLKRAGLLLRALEGDQPRSACIGLRHLLERDPTLPAPAVSTLLRLANHRDPATAGACLAVLTRLQPSSLAPVASLIPERAAAGITLHDPRRQRLWLALVATQGAAAVPVLLKAAALDDAALASDALELLAQTRGVSLPAWTAAVETRLARLLAGTGTASDPAVLHAAMAAAPRLGDSAELVAWLQSVFDRAAPVPEQPTATRAALHCAAAAALDRVREWPSRTFDCGGEAIPPWIGPVAAAEVLGHAEGSDAVRLTQLRRLFEAGDWHVKQAVMTALHSVEGAPAVPLIIAGLTHDHLEVQAAAAETLALLAPRLRTSSQALPIALSDPLRQAFQRFHVQNHVRGLRAFLSVVRMTRLRAELGPVTVMARSGISAVRHDARSLLDEWGHPQPTQAPEPVPNPISRQALTSTSVRVNMEARGQQLAFTFDPRAAPVTVARLIRWFQERPGLEVTDCRPGRHVVLGPSSGVAPGPWRSEESRAPIGRGTIVIHPRERDALQASLLILLADAPELEGRVTVVGQVTAGLSVLNAITLGEPVHVRAP